MLEALSLFVNPDMAVARPDRLLLKEPSYGKRLHYFTTFSSLSKRNNLMRFSRIYFSENDGSMSAVPNVYSQDNRRV